MTKQQPLMTLDQLVLESFTKAKVVLMEIFQTDKVSELSKYSKVLAALRIFDDEAMQELGKPLILGMFVELGADPKTQEGRDFAANFVDNIALALQDATSYVMGQAQQRAAAQSALQKGRGNLLAR